MEVRITTKPLSEYGLLQAGVPFLVDSHMRLVDGINTYLLEEIIMNAAWASPKTWHTYAYRLCDFFAYLEDNNFHWQEVDKHITGHYRLKLQVSGARDQPLRPNTIYDRIRCIDAFYQWALEKQFVNALPFAYKKGRKQKSFLFQQTGKTVSVSQNKSAPKRKQPVVRIPTREEIADWIKYLPTWRDQLMAWLIIESGLRREEVVRLDTRVLPHPQPNNFMSNVTQDIILNPAITPTKGSKERMIEITGKLNFQLHKYRYSGERACRCLNYRKRYGIDPTFLFLSLYAQPLSLSRLDKAFQKASQQSGITIYPHLLRKTFATHTLLFRKEALGGETATRQWLMARMGHTSFETTQLYVLLGQDLMRREIKVMDAYQENLSQLLDEVVHGNT